MQFFITDDDVAIRSMLTELIEDENLGTIAGETEDGSMLDESLPILKKVDILIIDLLMPTRDGIETIRRIKPTFNGKIIMISQVESKELVSKAYSQDIEYYITKPINRIEVMSVIKKVIERIRLEKSMIDVHQSLSNALAIDNVIHADSPSIENKIIDSGQILLSELGVIGENGSQDLLDILDFLFQYERKKTFRNGFPTLKSIFLQLAEKKFGTSVPSIEIKREIKASTQRVRRTIYQSLNHLASLGLTDFSNPTFESYAPKFFDFTIVRERMNELKNGQALSTTHIRINTKKFIQILYYEAKRFMYDQQ